MITVVSLFLFVAATTLLVGQNEMAAPEVTTFYEVALVCHAAPEIGCGSRAKPALLEMQSHPAIKEAWLNREGTVYAIVWKEKDQTQQVAKPIFEKHHITFTKVSSQAALAYSKTFREPKQWYKGADVDALSLVEAAKIAETYVGFLLTDKVISSQEASDMKLDLRTYFQRELVKIRSLEQLEAACQTTVIIYGRFDDLFSIG